MSDIDSLRRELGEAHEQGTGELVVTMVISSTAYGYLCGIWGHGS